MFHHVARGADRRLLFRTWEEGLALWRCVLRACPAPIALVLMPDHLHLLTEGDAHLALGRGLSGFARWRNHRRGERGAVFEPMPRAEPVAKGDKRRRSVRYVHLNPCRAGLARDPLAWPLSTHRDALGLAIPSAVRVRPDADRFHAWVSADPSCAVDGTPLPGWTRSTEDPEVVLHAVSAVTRTPLSALVEPRSPARRLYLRAAADLCPNAGPTHIGVLVRASRITAWRAAGDPADTRPIGRALHDPRFEPLLDGDLRRLPAWVRYRGR